MTQHRYREEPIPGLQDLVIIAKGTGIGKSPHLFPREWSPDQPKPETIQGWLGLEGSALGPLFTTTEDQDQ